MQYIEVVNWSEYQHYKKRRPPWIKLHMSLLTDYDFSALPDACKAHMVGLFLLSAQCDNRIPYDKKWIGSKINSKSPINFTRLFASGMLAICTQTAPLAVAQEEKRRGREEAEERREEADARGAMNLDPIPASELTDEDRIIRGWGDLLAGAGLPFDSVPPLPREDSHDLDSLAAAATYALGLLGGRAPLEARLAELVAYHAAGKGPDGKAFRLYSLRRTLSDPQLLKGVSDGPKRISETDYSGRLAWEKDERDG